METKYIKFFSGSSILVRGLQNLLNNNNIGFIVKDNVESARLAGFGEQRNAVDLYVLETDVVKATPIVTDYKVEINA